MNLSPQKLRSSAFETARPVRWTLTEVAGRLVEISGSGAAASLTLAFNLVLKAQQESEVVGWVISKESFFYPPDAAVAGVDLEALVVVRVPDIQAVPRAGEKLLRSGACGLVVLDIGSADVPTPLQTRLAGLAYRHHTALIFLTEKKSGEFSLSSLISLRLHAQRARTSENEFLCTLEVLKDKRRGPTWRQAGIFRGP
jgi:recombination protein RecA